MTDQPRPLLGGATTRAIADLGHSIKTADVERAFSEAGLTLIVVSPHEEQGQTIFASTALRISRTLASLDLTDRGVVQSVLRAVMDLSALYRATGSLGQRTLVRLEQHLEADGFFARPSGDPSAGVRSFGVLAGDALEDDSALRAELERLERSPGDDPGQSIGTAKRLLESTAKIVLVERGQGDLLTRHRNMPTLIKYALEALNLHPDQLDHTKPPALREALLHLEELALNLNTLRNEAGDGHGVGTAVTGVDARDARLAVRAAIAWCCYLLDTLSEARTLPAPDQSAAAP